MVINITLGFLTFDLVMLDRPTRGPACGFGCTGLVAAACANAEHPADRAITTVNGMVDKSVVKRRNMRLVRRGLLLGAPRLLVCFRRESLGGQRLG